MTHTADTNKARQKRRARRAGGFTLPEVMVALPLVALLFGGTITLFLESQRIVQRTGVTVQSSQDAGVGLRFISTTTREAIRFSLPPDTTSANTNGLAFLPPTAT
jgi:prepilin-type N-terminal cleavage/methylation domain-containing protein